MFCPFCGKPTQAPANTPGPDPVPYTGGKGLKSDDSDLYHDVNRGSAAEAGPVPVPPRPSGEKPGLKIDLSGLKNIKFPTAKIATVNLKLYINHLHKLEFNISGLL